MGLHKGRKKIKFTNFLMLGRDMVLHCHEWKQLSPSAKILYIHIKAKHNGTNNGDIILPYSELRAVEGFRSPSTASHAVKELVKKGWITKSGNGGLYRTPNRYALTGRYDDYITDRSHTVPEKYKESTHSVVQNVPPVGHDVLGPEIIQPVSPASAQVRTTETEATATKMCS